MMLGNKERHDGAMTYDQVVAEARAQGIEDAAEELKRHWLLSEPDNALTEHGRIVRDTLRNAVASIRALLVR